MRFFRDRAVATLLAMWMWRLLLLLLLQLISKEEKLNGFFLFFKAHLQYKKSEACFSFRCSLLASFLPSTSPNTTAKFRAGVQFYILQLLSHKGSHTHTGAGVSEWFTIKLSFSFSCAIFNGFQHLWNVTACADCANFLSAIAWPSNRRIFLSHFGYPRGFFSPLSSRVKRIAAATTFQPFPFCLPKFFYDALPHLISRHFLSQSKPKNA